VADVIPFGKKPSPEQVTETVAHGIGRAFCMSCFHHWDAAVPVGTTEFECPECHAMKGRWKFTFYPSEDTMVRECRCGNQLFYLTPEGHLCAECGSTTTGAPGRLGEVHIRRA
jgi:hypothetical protein